MAPNLLAGEINTNAVMEKVMPNRAYVTFLSGRGVYVKGVVGLARGLRRVKAMYPLVVAILPDVPEEHRRMLADHGYIIHQIEPVQPPENRTRFAMPYHAINYSKLRIWKDSRMIFLDSDIPVHDNSDHLFELPEGSFCAVMDCFCEKT